MHLHFINHYQKIKSPIHRLDARVKLVFIVAIILSCSLLPVNAWSAYILIFSVLIVIMLLSELSFAYIIKRSLLVLPFLLTAAPLIFHASDNTVGPISYTISPMGLIRFASLGIKSWLSVLAAILLASTTSFPELLLAMCSLKIPRILVAIFGLMWRYLSLMFEEVERLMRARQSRSSRDVIFNRHTGGNLFWRARVTGGMAGSLFVRSLERSERVYNAMLARGYDGEIRALDEPPIRGTSLMWLIISIVILFLLVIVANLLAGVP